MQTKDGRLQGAILYRVDAESVLESGEGAVYVDRLATAPWNRAPVTSSPSHSGVGSALLRHAIHHSHKLGLRGRVSLTTLPGATSFYAKLGFVDTGMTVEKLPLLELPADEARKILIKEGLVQDATHIKSNA